MTTESWLALKLIENPLTFIAIMCVATVWLSAWRRVREAKVNAALKHDMIERGFSADEICSVFAAQPRDRLDAGP